MKYILCTLLFVSAKFLFSQNNVIDSLQAELKITKNDIIKLQLLNQLFTEYEFSDIEKAKAYIDSAYELARKLNDKKGLLLTYTNLGFFAEDQSNFLQASIYYQKNLEISEELHDKESISAALTNLGNICYQTSDFVRSLDYYFKGLKIDEELNNEKGVSFSLNNIALVYESENEFEKALNYYSQSLKIKERLNDKKGIAATLSNIGIVYNKFHDYTAALKFEEQALKIYESFGYKAGIAYVYGTISEIYLNLSDTCKSIDSKNIYTKNVLYYAEKGLKIAEEVKDNLRISSLLNVSGSIYLGQNKFKEAEKVLKKALIISEEIGALELMSENNNCLSELYKKIGKYDLALKYFKKHISLRDSIFNEENTKKNVQSQMNYDFEKKELALTSEQAKKDVIADEEKQKQHIIRNSFITGFVLVLLLAIFILRGYLNKKKANLIISKQKEMVELAKKHIEEQKQVVEEKQKEILDSIHYAQRIQKALITPEKYFEKHLNKKS